MAVESGKPVAFGEELERRIQIENPLTNPTWNLMWNPVWNPTRTSSAERPHRQGEKFFCPPKPQSGQSTRVDFLSMPVQKLKLVPIWKLWGPLKRLRERWRIRTLPTQTLICFWASDFQLFANSVHNLWPSQSFRRFSGGSNRTKSLTNYGQKLLNFNKN